MSQYTSNSEKNRSGRFREKDYELYLQWASLPTIVKSLPVHQLASLGFDATENPLLEKLISLRFKKDFCREFRVSVDTIADWEKRPDFEQRLQQIRNRNQILRFEKEIDFAFTMKVLKEADAPRVKLWKQLYGGFDPNKPEIREINFTIKRVKQV